ncbi:hypothetical protein [Hydrogenophaga sp.]|uniref:hypothetical protein n=1 Tax=Hydrogenophaga sp. TaxID=1904254 RepID=UPI002FC68470
MVTTIVARSFPSVSNTETLPVKSTNAIVSSAIEQKNIGWIKAQASGDALSRTNTLVRDLLRGLLRSWQTLDQQGINPESHVYPELIQKVLQT